MTTIKSFTDLEQSKRLAEILRHESADMHYARAYFEGNESDWFVGLGRPIKSDDIIPCWSLAALLDVIPEGVIENYYTPNIQKENGKYSIAYGNDNLLCIADNPIDACYEMIIKLHELKML